MSPQPLKTRERLSEVRYEIRGELARRARELEAQGRAPIKLHIGREEALRLVGADPAKGPLIRALSACSTAEHVRVVLVDAEGPSFSAGLDTRMFTPEGVPGEPSLHDLALAPASALSFGRGRR